jgi:hypothetical protein
MGQTSKIAQLIPAITGSSKRALLLISVIVILIIGDIQFVSFTYGSNLEIPSSFHLYLFTISTIAVSAICILLLLAVKSQDNMTRISRPRLSRVAYMGTLLVQFSILLILVGIISEILIFHQYNTLFLLLVVYISHFFSAGLLVVLSLTFLHWFKLTKSFSMLIYAIVFFVTISLFMLAIPLLTEQYTSQPQWIYPRSYESLVDALANPTPDIAYIFGFTDYVLPIMIVCSWILTASLLRGSAKKIGNVKFWVIISIPLLYQFITYVVKYTNLITDPNVVQFVYSSQFQIITGISYQISGIFFAIAFLAIARKTQRKVMKNYLIICAIGIVSLFSSMQPGMPFYTAYPPFGLVTLSFLGISSYMLLVGMLGSAAYISTDSELRREVFKGIDNNSDLFKMGRAEMQREIESRVSEAYKHIDILDEMRDRIDKDEDIKVMMQEVLEELHPRRSVKSGDSSH